MKVSNLLAASAALNVKEPPAETSLTSCVKLYNTERPRPTVSNAAPEQMMNSDSPGCTCSELAPSIVSVPFGVSSTVPVPELRNRTNQSSPSVVTAAKSKVSMPPV